MQQTPSNAPAAADFELAIDHFMAGRLPDAERACRRALAAEPAHPHALHMLALIRIGAGGLHEALALLEQALATGVKHPAIELAHGRLLADLNRPGEAIAALQRSLALDPRQPPVIALLANMLSASGRANEARGLLDRALAAWPEDPHLLPASGAVHLEQGAYAKAETDLQHALAVSPSDAESYSNLATFYEHSNRLDEVQRLLDSAAKLGLVNSACKLIAARLLRSQGQAGAARALLTELQGEKGVTPTQQRDLQSEFGWCADALGDVSAAMLHFQEAKDRALVLAAPPLELPEIFPRQVASLKRFLAQNALPSGDAPAEPTPAFLVGFPRSGTTLLDTMLGAHPRVFVMEEQPSIQAMLDLYIARGLHYADDLARLTSAHHAELRAAHQQVSRAAGWDGVRRLVDKSPFGTSHLGLIHQVFPAAPIVFMVRHPCDVILSCFMNNFKLHSGTVHFTRLDSTVALYCSIMDLWQLYVQRLPLKYLVLRYEDLIASPEAEMRRLTGFLDLPWEPQVLDHRAAALQRGYIPTPSYSQVSQPLYRSSSDRWRRYAAHLEPYMPQLMPYIRAFGYEA
ncbi:MAG TPA: sulfotransferase [Gammaproteobacteria bacterium]|nr:sulfotransferase [Gammaproteobacteria bacterium]